MNTKISKDKKPVFQKNRVADYDNLHLIMFKYVRTNAQGIQLKDDMSEYRVNVVAKSLKAAAQYIATRLGKDAHIRITETSGSHNIDFIADNDIKIMIDERLRAEELDLALLQNKIDIAKAVEKGTVEKAKHIKGQLSVGRRLMT